MILGKILERQLFLTLARIGVAFALLNWCMVQKSVGPKSGGGVKVTA